MNLLYNLIVTVSETLVWYRNLSRRILAFEGICRLLVKRQGVGGV